MSKSTSSAGSQAYESVKKNSNPKSTIKICVDVMASGSGTTTYKK
jgi:hypothetical protein